ncbi:MAG: bifunctional oligoribonuclease/PAP phosphatase NrnA [Synergistaceae bacterium]|nr:bifunctional oligoribonuclease/PAP phosphatase NrnA [Synergistaceae bacterium]
MTDPLLPTSDLLKGSPSWVLFTHRKADGDAMGSASALFETGIRAGKSVAWFGPDPLPPAYNFLAHWGEYRVFEGAYPFDDRDLLYVFLDCANETRSVAGFENRNGEVRVLNIDHHADNSRFGTVNCVDPASSSTAELLFRVLKEGSWDLSHAAAEGLYTGIWTDSGGFSFSNTTPRTHRLAAELMELGEIEPSRLDDHINQSWTLERAALWGRALSHVKIFGPDGVFVTAWLSLADFSETGADPSETEGLSSSLLRFRGSRLAAFLTEQANGEARVSFRSREGIFGAADVARELGGGGHPRAAGATVPGPLDVGLERISRLLEERYAKWNPAD